MPIVVGIRFKAGGRVYYFSPEGIEFAEGDGAVVETSRGLEYGTVAMAPAAVEENTVVQPLKPIVRKATEKDVEQVARLVAKKDDAMRAVEEKIAKHNLEMKLVDAEFSFDGSKVIFYFTSDSRVDFRELVRDLASYFRTRIELRQIGIRDECKMLGGIAPCGRVCCCSGHLPDFKRVSIKMAKNQGLSLNPTKISGLCGRLMCCLEYENEHYAQIVKRMPKIGSEVTTPDGKGTVAYNHLLKEIVRVRVPIKDTFEFREYPLADIKTTRTLADELARDNDKIDADIKKLLD
ncbi:MAG: stage 0 sporulation family protein [Clostridiales bacterium]|jgi:cell fate regulator YaaT (PSP1 superfamily)|nr:stage 0 sporulation family protein [Clostridiales bacterium]